MHEVLILTIRPQTISHLGVCPSGHLSYALIVNCKPSLVKNTKPPFVRMVDSICDGSVYEEEATIQQGFTLKGKGKELSAPELWCILKNKFQPTFVSESAIPTPKAQPRSAMFLHSKSSRKHPLPCLNVYRPISFQNLDLSQHYCLRVNLCLKLWRSHPHPHQLLISCL